MLLIFFVIYLIKAPKRNQQLLPRCARLGGGVWVSVSLLWFATWFWVLFFILKFNSCQTIRAKTTKGIFRLQDVCSPQLTMPSALMVISSDRTHFHCYSAFASPYPPKKKGMWIQVFNPTRREGKRSNRNIFTIQLRMWLPGHHALQGTRCSLRIHLRWRQQSLPLSRRNLCRAWHQGPS